MGAGIFGVSNGEFDAPEVRDGKRAYSAVSDIYSLGRLMCFTANGGSFPKGRNAFKLPDADPEFVEIIKKASANEPEDRYGSAAELRRELEKITVAKRTVRRAMAIACAMDTVKRNGGVIRPAPKPEEPEEKSKPGFWQSLFKRKKK